MGKTTLLKTEVNDSIRKRKEAVILFKEDYSSFTFRKTLTILEKGIIVSEEIVEELTFPLSLISEDELFKERFNTKKPGFVLKVGDLLYYTKVPKNMNLNIITNPHLCAGYKHECANLSAAPEIAGGCSKVQDRSIEFYSKVESDWAYIKNLRDSKRLEKYDFITFGFETFNTSCNAFIVVSCNNYKCCVERQIEEDIEDPTTTPQKRKPYSYYSRKNKPASQEFWNNMIF